MTPNGCGSAINNLKDGEGSIMGHDKFFKNPPLWVSSSQDVVNNNTTTGV